MLDAHPELFDYFNPVNQRSGGQAASLAASVLAYASHIANPAPLSPMIERIANKHVSLQVKPEHYPIVGQYLLGAIVSVLGPAATPAIVEAWTAAYGQLATIMIGREAALEAEAAASPVGWSGFRSLRVARRVRESDVMTSFVLEAADGSALPGYQPGQYLSVRVRAPGFPHDQVRQHSLSAAPNGRNYRISVKRELSSVPGAAPGLVSNFLHDTMHEGDLLDVHAPLGDFVLRPGTRPMVLISAGSGITAVLSMLEHLAEAGRETVFLHAIRNRSHHAFSGHVRELAARAPQIRLAITYAETGPGDRLGMDHDLVGSLNTAALREHLPQDQADVYLCGPPGFLAAMDGALDSLGDPAAHRFSEAFAPDQSFAPATQPLQAAARTRPDQSRTAVSGKNGGRRNWPSPKRRKLTGDRP